MLLSKRHYQDGIENPRYIIMTNYRIAIIAPLAPVRAGIAALINACESADWDREKNRIIYQTSYLADLIEDQPEVDLLIITSDAISRSDLVLLEDAYINQLSIIVLGQDQEMIDSIMKLSLGSWGFLPLDINGDILDAAIQAIKYGLVVTSMEFLSDPNSQLIHSWTAVDDSIIEDLSLRENEVLDHLARGLSNKQIAYKLGISEHTVKFHISAIYSKLGVNNRAEAVRVGIQHGYVSI